VVDGAVVGIGVGLIGSLLVGKVLEGQKNNCHYRYKRDGASTRFLPSGNCYPHNYQPPNVGYQPAVSGYQPASSNYKPVNSGYQSINVGYQPPAPLNVYHPPTNTYNPPVSGYQPANNGYQPANNVYQPPPTNNYQPTYPSNSYQPSTGYQSPGYQIKNNHGFSQTSTYKATPAPFKFGVGK